MSENGLNGWQWHDDVIKWKHSPRYWSFVRGTHRSPVNSRSFNVFFDLRLNQQWSEQWRSWWFETPLRSLWRHYDGQFQICNPVMALRWSFRIFHCIIDFTMICSFQKYAVLYSIIHIIQWRYYLTMYLFGQSRTCNAENVSNWWRRHAV